MSDQPQSSAATEQEERLARAIRKARDFDPDTLYQHLGDDYPIDSTDSEGRTFYRSWRKELPSVRAVLAALTCDVAQPTPVKPLPGELALIQIAMETLRFIASYSPVSRIQPVMIARDALKKIEALTFESEPVALAAQPPAAPVETRHYCQTCCGDGKYDRRMCGLPPEADNTCIDCNGTGVEPLPHSSAVAAPVETATKSAPTPCTPHNSGERLPSSDAAEVGADTHLSADTVDEIAKWLHDETGHPDSYPDHTWPETDRDDGRREGGWVKIVPQHAQAYFRDIARRMVARFMPAAPQTLRGK